MGSEEEVDDDDEERVGYYNDQPRHRVEITKPFLVGQTQVTQRLWEAVMGSNPSHFDSNYWKSEWSDDLPVEEVSWFDCVRFCNKLSELAGLDPAYEIGSGDKPDVSLDLARSGYRLPTEAEWEYMAKAGTELTYAGSDDLNEVAWYGNYEGSTHPVAEKEPNLWGIYDCSGNVEEWCSDDLGNYDGRDGLTRDPYGDRPEASCRAFRGGSWGIGDDRCRVSYRCGYQPGDCLVGLGLRLSRSLG